MASANAGSFLRFGDKVSRILDDAWQTLKVLGSVPSDPDKLSDALKAPAITLPPVLAHRLSDEARIEGSFLAAGGLDSIVVREAMKTLLHDMKPEDFMAVKKLGKPSPSVDAFSEVWMEMRKHIANRMDMGDASKVADERSIRIQDRIERAEHKAAVMAEALATSRSKWQREMADIVAHIEKLEKEIQEVHSKGESNDSTLKTYTSQQTDALLAAHEDKEAEFRTELATLQAEFQRISEANATAAANLRKRRNHLRAEYSRVLSDYDRDMIEMQGKIEKAKELIEKERTQLEILQQHFVLVDADNGLAADEMVAYKKRMEARKAAQNRRILPSVRKIQRWWKKILELRAWEKKRNKAKGKPAKKK